MEFIPETDDRKIQVPFYGEVKGQSDEGWMGHETRQTIGGLKSEISAALGRLGATVSGFTRGRFEDENTGLIREAVRIHYSVANEHGDMWPGQIDIASLPINRKRCQNAESYKVKIDKSLRMAMYMTLTALKGSWNMRVLSPGFSPLMPWMLLADGETFSQKWEESLSIEGISKMLPEPQIDGSPDIIDGDFEEVDDE